jgi:tetratricopeptide (TPR) repeat protein
MNSAAETESHKEMLRPLLADSFRNHLTVVIGYSGEADAAFKVMEEEFNSHQNLIWLGYEAEPKPHLRKLLSKDYAFYIGECDFDRAMIELADALGCWPPEVIQNPPRHILEELVEVSDYPVASETGIDLLTSTRRRLADAANHWDSGKDAEARAQEAVISETSPEPVSELEALSEKEVEARAWASYKMAVDLMKEAALHHLGDPKALEKPIAMYENALALKPDMHQAMTGSATLMVLQANSSKDKKYAAARLEEARKKLVAANKIAPDNVTTLRGLGITLSTQARTLNGEDALRTLSDGATLFERALELDPENRGVIQSYLNNRLLQIHHLAPEERKTALDGAERLAERLTNLTGKASYNKACIYAYRGDVEASLNELKACIRDDTLPSREHIQEDKDLEILRDQPEFEMVLNAAKTRDEKARASSA